MSVYDIHLPPVVSPGIRARAIVPVLLVWPPAMEIFNIVELHKAVAVRTNEYEGIGQKPDETGLVENEISWVDKGLVLVVQKRIVNALLWQDGNLRPAVRGALKPALYEFSQVLE